MTTLSRRRFVGAALVSGASLALGSRGASAFGEEGAFNPRVLLAGGARFEGVRTTAPARWAAELIGRTSAPARRTPSVVKADEAALLAEPFAVWGGDADVPPLTDREVANLKKFIALGGILFVDDFAPDVGAFGKAARREIARVIPEGSPIAIGGDDHVIFKSFYLLKRAVGRVEGPAKLDAILRGGAAQVIFAKHDLLGALAKSASGTFPLQVTPGGEGQRERAVRFAVNVAMYVLCSNYKDDQVHAKFLMRKRGPSSK